MYGVCQKKRTEGVLLPYLCARSAVTADYMEVHMKTMNLADIPQAVAERIVCLDQDKVLYLGTYKDGRDIYLASVPERCLLTPDLWLYSSQTDLAERATPEIFREIISALPDE